MDDRASRCRDEVEQLHAFFQAWFRGELPPDDEEAFARFADVLAPAFTMIDPAGRAGDRAATLAAVRSGHGAEPGMTIGIRDHRHRLSGGDLSLVTYEEWQTRGGVTRGRVSSALFRANDATPNGVEWLHVHETWLGA
ncbi:MAG: DUF4440 domain-containing protein [Planctomycetota bacterium]|jgi:hypothetical protein